MHASANIAYINIGTQPSLFPSTFSPCSDFSKIYLPLFDNIYSVSKIIMGCWSPLNAMKAYVHILQLCKDCTYNKGSNNSSNKPVEPECIEFISALAAGNQATLMVDIIASNGCLSPSTLALAIAAQHTGGHLICICPDQEAIQQTKSHIEELNIVDVVTFKAGDPCKVIKQYKNIDFAVVDRRIEDLEEVLFALDMNPNGSVIVMSNLSHGIRRERAASHIVHHARKFSSRGGIKSEILPIGGGMEVTKIGKGCRRGSNNRPKRTFLVYEE